jgi:hypothetical protein
VEFDTPETVRTALDSRNRWWLMFHAETPPIARSARKCDTAFVLGIPKDALKYSASEMANPVIRYRSRGVVGRGDVKTIQSRFCRRIESATAQIEPLPHLTTHQTRLR